SVNLTLCEASIVPVSETNAPSSARRLSFVDEPPSTMTPETVLSSTLNVSGVMVLGGSSTNESLRADDGALVSLTGTIEASQRVRFTDSSFQFHGGTLISVDSPASSGVLLINSTITRDSASRFITTGLDARGTDISLFEGDEIEELVITDGSFAIVNDGTELNTVFATLNGNISFLGDTSAKFLRALSNATIRLNSGRLTAGTIEITDGSGAAQLVQNGGNFTTEVLFLRGGQQVTIGENDEVTKRISIINGTQLEIRKPLTLPNDGLGDSLQVQNSELTYIQPTGVNGGLDVTQFGTVSRNIDLVLNRTETNGLVWGIRVPGNRPTNVQPLVDDGRITSNGPIEVIYDADLYGDFTYVGFVADQVILGDVNGDGDVNLLDVGPFVQTLAQGLFIPEADTNGDGVISLLDVGPFIDLLNGP
ncbi:MAG: dockerin type I domain-containing protein, partial [Planctomycetota bacterium]